MSESVNAVFNVEDRATSQLEKIASAFGAVQARLDQSVASAEEFSQVRFGSVTRSVTALTERLEIAGNAAQRLSDLRFGNTSRSMQGLSRSIEQLTSNIEAMPVSLESSMSRVIAQTERATSSVIALRNAYQQATVAGARLGGGGLGGGGGGGGGAPGGGGGGGGRGGRGRGGFGGGGYGRMGLGAGGLAVHGGFHGGLTEMALGYGAYKAVEEAGEVDLDVTNAMMNLGMADMGTPQAAAMRQTIMETLSRGTQGTVFSQNQAAPSLASFYGILGGTMQGTPEEKAKKLAPITGTALRFAETETLMHHGSIEENMNAFAGFSHLLRKYKPEEMGPVSDKLLAISRMTGASPEQIERVMKYSVTTGGLAGVSSDELLDTTGFLLQSGITGTTAGTGISQVIQSLLKGSTPKEGRRHIDHALEQRSEFEKAIHGSVGTGRQRGESAPHESARLAAWEKLGIVDPKTHSIGKEFIAEDGGVKIIAILEQLSKMADKMSKVDFAKLELAAIDVRGARATEPFLGKDQLDLFFRYMAQREILSSKLGVDKTQSNLADRPLQEMEQFLARLKDLGIALVTTTGLLDKLGEMAKLGAEVFASLANRLNGIGQVPEVPDAIKQRLGPNYHPQPPGIFGGSLEEWSAFSGGSKYHAPNLLEKMVTPGLQTPPTMRPYDPHHTVTDPSIQRENFRTGGDVHVHMENISFSGGDMHEQVDKLVGIITEKLRRAMLNDLGRGFGSGSSGYASGSSISI